jgi:REP element-mobilizing transposase RayT
MEHDTWHWQEPQTAWRGVGLYHITLVVPTREALLGTLLIPDNDPALAKVEVLPLGRALVNALWDMPQSHPDIQVLHYCLMPDHLHMIWYVRHPLKKESIKTAVQGFWQGVKQIGRFFSFDNSSFTPTASRNNAKNIRAGSASSTM